ncbi:hypothetical protein IQ260_24855 [Leptolyngbya cf. ectocarpi LEGE 11479]|uniref:Uncharacterized protein n=1 Tax=Leptolyngbya cf. ectocarpi LEGE 11479 TaxID=1828722 RepID=A0A929FAC1_LEPEC|nr:hypothetical protein [Leptolyngbya ectocarpi]MBE9069876.1 hypothetical protein [Leptolyngbya cf. ectocarpi LEGE 11479]
MSLARFSSFLAAIVIGFVACVSPVSADSRDSIPNTPNIDAIFQVEPDFFDRGREQFELEIENLMQNQLDNSDVPILTIDESVLLDTEAFELLEKPPMSPDVRFQLKRILGNRRVEYSPPP